MGKLIDKVSTAESYGETFEEAYSKIDCEKGQGLNRPSDANPAHMIWNPKLKGDPEKDKDIPEDWMPAAVQPVIIIAGKSSSEITEQLGKIDGNIKYLQGNGPKPTQQPNSESKPEPKSEPEPEPKPDPKPKDEKKDENQEKPGKKSTKKSGE